MTSISCSRTAIAVLAMALAAGGGPAHASAPASPITLKMELTRFDPVNASGEVVISVVSIFDAPGTKVELILPAGAIADKFSWLVDLKAGESVEFSSNWSLTERPGNVTIGARANRPVNARESWGDMRAIPLHVDASASLTAEGWKVLEIPVAELTEPGDAAILSMHPTPFVFPDKSDAMEAVESLPATDALEDRVSTVPPGHQGIVTLTGTWQYFDRSNTARVSDQQLIEVRRGDGSALNPRVYCFTNSGGAFSCSFTHPGSTMRVWLRSWTNLNPGPTRLGVFSGIEVTGGCGSDSLDCTYASQTGEISCADGTSCSVGTWTAGGAEPARGAHQMTQDLIRSWKKLLLDNTHGIASNGGPAKITYPVPMGHGTHAHTANNGSENSGDPWLSIEVPKQTSADVVAHEYGHAVMDNRWFGLTPNWPLNDCPSPHIISQISGRGCALSEGFANFWSWYSNEFYDGDNSTTNDGPIYDDPGFSLDFETRSNSSGPFAGGDRVEGNVAAVFGDMFDTTNEGPGPGGAADHMSDGIKHVWHTIAAASADDFSDWWNDYRNHVGHDPGPALEVMRLNTINYGFVANDICVNAKNITVNSYTDIISGTWNATTDSTDPAVGCGNTSRAKSVWYRFTPQGAGVLSADTFGSNYDTILAVYTGSCTSLTAVPGGCNDDYGSRQSRVTFNTTPGVTYYFLVSAYANDGGTLQFNLAYTPFPPPANDNRENATAVTQANGTFTIDTRGATVQAADPYPSCGNGGRTSSVWYSFHLLGPGIVTIDTIVHARPTPSGLIR